MATDKSTSSRRGRVQPVSPSLSGVDNQLQEPMERQAYRSIRRALMGGLITTGTTLSIRSLAQELGVSPQPVRDALKRLEADGVLEGRPQSGFYLRDLSQAEYAEINEIRQRLEGLAGRHAAGNLSASKIKTLRKLNGEMRKAKLSSNYLVLNYQIHFTIYAHAKRPELLAIIQNFWVRIGPALNHIPHLELPYDVHEIHDSIIDALENRDADAAEAAICRDLACAAEFVLPSLPDRNTQPDNGEQLFVFET